MARDIQEPVTVSRDKMGGREETETSHPAFAQIGVSRVSGHTNLFDSDFAHNAFMVIRIHPTKLIRNLSNDWFFADRVPYIEVALSEQQWATFVSSPNVGDGVPCTLQHLAGRPVPQLPSPPSRTDQFKAEMLKDAEDTVQACRDLERLIDSLGLPKGKADQLRGASHTIRAKVTSSMPFVAEQFDEHMEGVVEKAKAEVHGYMTGVLQRAGIAALTGPDATLPLALGGPDDAEPA